ncbi:MAG: VanW family protein [Clostridia bacterium]
MKKVFSLLLPLFLLLFLPLSAYAGVMVVSSTPSYDDSEAMSQNLDRAMEALNGKAILKGQPFSFNEMVGPRTEESGYALAPNGNGVPVMGGGVSQVATTLHMALKELGGDILYDETNTFGTTYTAGYAEKPTDAILTDYGRGLDYRFTSNHVENLSISMWRAGSTVFCQLTGIGTATAAPAATPEPEASPVPNTTPELTAPPDPGQKTLYIVNVQNYVNLRNSASTKAEAIAQIPKGKSVQSTGEKDGEFAQVIWEDKTGYVHGDYLSQDNPDPERLKVINCTTSVTLRKGPSAQTKKLAAIPLGDDVKYLGVTEGDFRKVEFDGKVGYVMASYLTSPSQEQNREENDT